MTATRLLLAATLLLVPATGALAFGNKPAGSSCLFDTDCDDNRCGYFPDGQRYCVAAGKACAAPGSEGASPGKANVKGECFECVQGLGWHACPPAAPANGRVMPMETRNR